AEHQRVEFSVAVTPATAQQLRYQWKVSPDGCTISAPSSKDTGVTCGKTGSYTMTCAVKSADGADLGSGTGSLGVTISQSDISTGKKKDEAKKKLDSARQLWSQKKYDEAIAAAEAAAGVDPKLAQPVLAQFSQELKKMGWDAVNKADLTEAVKRLTQAVKLNPADADAKKKLEEAKKYASAWPRVEAKAKEFDAFIAEKKVWSAQKAMLEMQDILRGQSGGQASTNPLWARVMADFNKGVAWYNDFSRKSNAEWTRLFKAEDWAKAEAHIKQVLAYELTPADRKHYEAALQTASANLAKKKESMARCEAKWTEGQALYNAGKHSEALAKFKENVACAPGNAQRETYVRQLEDALRKQAAAKQACLAVRQQGDALVQQKRYADAIAKYRESLKCNPDAQLEAYIRQLEGEVRKQTDAQASAARANQLRAEGTQLQNQKRYAEAIAKYRESLRYVPDKALEQHVARIEAEVKRQNDQQVLQARAKTLRDEGAALQGQNRIREAIAKYRESLKYVPDPQLEAHIRKLEASLSAKPSMPTATSSGPTAGSWTGAWKSNPGKEGEVINFNLSASGGRITGTFSIAVPYTTSSGARKTETFGGPLEGTITGNRTKGTFREAGDTKPSGTFEAVMAANGSQFTCTVRGTDGSESRTYTVSRVR
ncbi:MAG: hypothetical protein GXX82_05580, partial [Syntrophorhabdus sp.]|nr:hypothetical protein [Syntrophorhabdus sp.]